MDGNKVPQTIEDIKGDGRWKLNPWRQIPTTPDNDACVDADLVEGLLKQRDIAQREKDFGTADDLLEAAKECFAIVEEFAPDKLNEITMVLSKSPGRESQVLKRLKNQYLF